MSGIYIIIALAAVIFALYTMQHGQRGAGSRRNQQKADDLIMRAEGYIMTGQLDAAESAYNQATFLAAGDPLLLSEAHYGLARVCERKADVQAAVRQVEAALSYAPQWREYKPNFEQLLLREKQRWLGEISKQL